MKCVNLTHKKRFLKDSGKDTCATDVARGDFALEPEKAKPASRKAKSQAAQETWFSTFWASAWKKRGKAQARKAFLKLVRSKTDFELVMAALARDFDEFMGRAEQFRPHPATWLHSEDWREPTPAEPAALTLDEQIRLAKATDTVIDWSVA